MSHSNDSNEDPSFFMQKLLVIIENLKKENLRLKQSEVNNNIALNNESGRERELIELIKKVVPVITNLKSENKKLKQLDTSKNIGFTQDLVLKDTLVNDVIDDKYELGYQSPIILDKLGKISGCVKQTDLIFEKSVSNMDTYKGDLKVGCFSLGNTTASYVFRSGLKNMMTELFIKNLGPTPLFELFTIKIIDNMNGLVKQYIKNYNLTNKDKLKDNDIVYLYKGGNIIRMHIDKTLNAIGSQSIYKCTLTENVMDMIRTVKEVKSKQKYGDWDMSFYINNHLPVDIFNKIKHDLNKLLLALLQKLRLEFADLIYNDYHSLFLELVADIQATYFGDEVQNTIKNYDPDVELISITSMGFEIKKNSICKVNRIKKNSSATIKEDSIKHNGQKAVMYYIELDKLLNGNDGVDTLNASDLYVTSTEDIQIISGGFQNHFLIDRLKMHNTALFRKNGVDTILSLPYELIDAVITERDDALAIYIHDNLSKINGPTVESYLHMENYYSLPSVQYLYFDLDALLTAQSIFIWEDKKYGKRLFRWALTALSSSIRDGFETKKIWTVLRNLFNFFTKMSFTTDKFWEIKKMFKIVNNKIELTDDNYDIIYFKRILIHYLHCITCVTYIFFHHTNTTYEKYTYFDDVYKNYGHEVFKHSINFKEVPGAMFLTKQFSIYTEHDMEYYRVLIADFEKLMLEYIGQMIKIINPAHNLNKKITLDNIIISL